MEIFSHNMECIKYYTAGSGLGINQLQIAAAARAGSHVRATTRTFDR